jgi:hypothetical protein
MRRKAFSVFSLIGGMALAATVGVVATPSVKNVYQKKQVEKLHKKEEITKQLFEMYYTAMEGDMSKVPQNIDDLYTRAKADRLIPRNFTKDNGFGQDISLSIDKGLLIINPNLPKDKTFARLAYKNYSGNDIRAVDVDGDTLKHEYTLGTKILEKTIVQVKFSEKYNAAISESNSTVVSKATAQSLDMTIAENQGKEWWEYDASTETYSVMGWDGDSWEVKETNNASDKTSDGTYVASSVDEINAKTVTSGSKLLVKDGDKAEEYVALNGEWALMNPGGSGGSVDTNEIMTAFEEIYSPQKNINTNTDVLLTYQYHKLNNFSKVGGSFSNNSLKCNSSNCLFTSPLVTQNHDSKDWANIFNIKSIMSFDDIFIGKVNGITYFKEDPTNGVYVEKSDGTFVDVPKISLSKDSLDTGVQYFGTPMNLTSGYTLNGFEARSVSEDIDIVIFAERRDGNSYMKMNTYKKDDINKRMHFIESNSFRINVDAYGSVDRGTNLLREFENTTLNIEEQFDYNGSRFFILNQRFLFSINKETGEFGSTVQLDQGTYANNYELYNAALDKRSNATLVPGTNTFLTQYKYEDGYWGEAYIRPWKINSDGSFSSVGQSKQITTTSTTSAADWYTYYLSDAKLDSCEDGFVASAQTIHTKVNGSNQWRVNIGAVKYNTSTWNKESESKVEYKSDDDRFSSINDLWLDCEEKINYILTSNGEAHDSNWKRKGLWLTKRNAVNTNLDSILWLHEILSYDYISESIIRLPNNRSIIVASKPSGGHLSVGTIDKNGNWTVPLKNYDSPISGTNSQHLKIDSFKINDNLYATAIIYRKTDTTDAFAKFITYNELGEILYETDFINQGVIEKTQIRRITNDVINLYSISNKTVTEGDEHVQIISFNTVKNTLTKQEFLNGEVNNMIDGKVKYDQTSWYIDKTIQASDNVIYYYNKTNGELHALKVTGEKVYKTSDLNIDNIKSIFKKGFNAFYTIDGVNTQKLNLFNMTRSEEDPEKISLQYENIISNGRAFQYYLASPNKNDTLHYFSAVLREGTEQTTLPSSSDSLSNITVEVIEGNYIITKKWNTETNAWDELSRVLTVEEVSVRTYTGTVDSIDVSLTNIGDILMEVKNFNLNTYKNINNEWVLIDTKILLEDNTIYNDIPVLQNYLDFNNFINVDSSINGVEMKCDTINCLIITDETKIKEGSENIEKIETIETNIRLKNILLGQNISESKIKFYENPSNNIIIKDKNNNFLELENPTVTLNSNGITERIGEPMALTSGYTIKQFYNFKVSDKVEMIIFPERRDSSSKIKIQTFDRTTNPMTFLDSMDYLYNVDQNGLSLNSNTGNHSYRDIDRLIRSNTVYKFGEKDNDSLLNIFKSFILKVNNENGDIKKIKTLNPGSYNNILDNNFGLKSDKGNIYLFNEDIIFSFVKYEDGYWGEYFLSSGVLDNNNSYTTKTNYQFTTTSTTHASDWYSYHGSGGIIDICSDGKGASAQLLHTKINGSNQWRIYHTRFSTNIDKNSTDYGKFSGSWNTHDDDRFSHVVDGFMNCDTNNFHLLSTNLYASTQGYRGLWLSKIKEDNTKALWLHEILNYDYRIFSTEKINNKRYIVSSKKYSGSNPGGAAIGTIDENGNWVHPLEEFTPPASIKTVTEATGMVINSFREGSFMTFAITWERANNKNRVIKFIKYDLDGNKLFESDYIDLGFRDAGEMTKNKNKIMYYSIRHNAVGDKGIYVASFNPITDQYEEKFLSNEDLGEIISGTEYSLKNSSYFSVHEDIVTYLNRDDSKLYAIKVSDSNSWEITGIDTNIMPIKAAYHSNQVSYVEYKDGENIELPKDFSNWSVENPLDPHKLTIKEIDLNFDKTDEANKYIYKFVSPNIGDRFISNKANIKVFQE